MSVVRKMPPWFEGTLVVCGRGFEEVEFSDRVSYLGDISDKKFLSEIMSGSAFLLNPSIRNGHWEELFGLSIIEAMACGCIPVATDHAGPREIEALGLRLCLLSEDEYVDKAVSFCSEMLMYPELMSQWREGNSRGVRDRFARKSISRLWRNGS
jgi:glycosyltransferase involved in cell wall biosynthesis